MTVSPDFDAFAACYNAGKPQLVSTKLVADLENTGIGLPQASPTDGQPSCWNRSRAAGAAAIRSSVQARRDLALHREGRDQPTRAQRCAARAARGTSLERCAI